MAQSTASHESSARPWPEEWDENLVTLLASGIVNLSDRLGEATTFPVPYPPPLQRALDHAAAMCLSTDVSAPRSVMDLLDWATRPFEEWPLRLSVDGMDLDERLLIDGRPSKACVECALVGGDVEAELNERRQMRAVRDRCETHNRPDTYVAFRKLLIEHPAMSERALTIELGRPELSLLSRELRQAYRPAPPETLVDGFAEVCAGCKNLRVPKARGRRVCLEWDCPDPRSPGERLPAVEGVVWLARELRMFVTAPGRPELRIAAEIERLLERQGVKMLLWPDFDAYDLRPDRLAWPADVKTWANPIRLARRLNERRFHPPADAERAFIVIASEQVVGREHYLRAVIRHCDWLERSRHIELVTEQTYVRRVVARLEAGKP